MVFYQLDCFYLEVQVPILLGTCPLGLSAILHLKDGFFRIICSTPLLHISFGRRPQVVFKDPTVGRRYLDK